MQDRVLKHSENKRVVRPDLKIITMFNNSGLMTIEDLAGYLKVTRRTIYDWLKQNKIPAIKLIGQWRFKKDKIDAWLENKSLS